jgi:hypothetical protein
MKFKIDRASLGKLPTTGFGLSDTIGQIERQTDVRNVINEAYIDDEGVEKYDCR